MGCEGVEYNPEEFDSVVEKDTRRGDVDVVFPCDCGGFGSLRELRGYYLDLPHKD